MTDFVQMEGPKGIDCFLLSLDCIFDGYGLI